MYICATWVEASICSADGSTHTETNKLYGKVKHRYRPNLSPRQRPTAKSRHDQAALAASAEARGATHRARSRRSDSPLHTFARASSTDSTRSTHFTLTQRHRWKETDGKVWSLKNVRAWYNPRAARRRRHEQALVCLSNREIVDESRGCTFHCKLAKDRLVPGAIVVFHTWMEAGVG